MLRERKKVMNEGGNPLIHSESGRTRDSSHSLSQPSHYLCGVHAEHDDGGVGSMCGGRCGWVNEGSSSEC
jgi:hypothetical protein